MYLTFLPSMCGDKVIVGNDYQSTFNHVVKQKTGEKLYEYIFLHSFSEMNLSLKLKSIRTWYSTSQITAVHNQTRVVKQINCVKNYYTNVLNYPFSKYVKKRYLLFLLNQINLTIAGFQSEIKREIKTVECVALRRFDVLHQHLSSMFTLSVSRCKV